MLNLLLGFFLFQINPVYAKPITSNFERFTKHSQEECFVSLLEKYFYDFNQEGVKVDTENLVFPTSAQLSHKNQNYSLMEFNAYFESVNEIHETVRKDFSGNVSIFFNKQEELTGTKWECGISEQGDHLGNDEAFTALESEVAELNKGLTEAPELYKAEKSILMSVKAKEGAAALLIYGLSKVAIPNEAAIAKQKAEIEAIQKSANEVKAKGKPIKTKSSKNTKNK